MSEINLEQLSQSEMEAVRAVLYSMRVVREATGHGAIEINIADNKVVQVDTSIRIRPQITAPWRA